MKITAKVLKNLSDETLQVVRNSVVERYHIDRTYYGPEWNRKHGMTVTEIVETDSGEKFEIWKKGYELACAIPAQSA